MNESGSTVERQYIRQRISSIQRAVFGRGAEQHCIRAIMLVWLAAAAVPVPAFGGEHTFAVVQDTLSPAELKKRSLEELMEIDITSVSKREEPFFTSAASVFVITSEDIEESGVKSLPEALRLAPNLQVAQIDARQWAISARGFNTTTANKLLVLIDGRSVYTTLYSGVFWDVQDVFLPDVERIEVISGPGGTLWGANAVNGVINIITRSAKETDGAMVRAGAGSNKKFGGGVRSTSALGDEGKLRVYAKYTDWAASINSNGTNADNDWNLAQGGFRYDTGDPLESSITVQGDVYGGRGNQPQNADLTLAGGNVLGRWIQPTGAKASLQVQAYFDYTKRIIPPIFREDLGTFDFDVQQQFPLDSRQIIVAGLNYRRGNDRVGNTAQLSFLPADVTTNLYSGFIQDEIAVSRDVRLTLGSKFQRDDFSGNDIQPSARIGWSITGSQFGWAAISRAVRTPSRIDKDFFVPGVPPYFIAGGPDFFAERLTAYELGYRIQPQSNLLLDIASYYNVYNHLRSVEPVGGTLQVANGLEGTTYGVEVRANTSLSSRLSAVIGYTFLKKDINLKPGSHDFNNGQGEGNDPQNQFSLRSLYRVSAQWQIDGLLRFVDNLPDAASPIPAYFTLDLNIKVKPMEDFEIALLGENLIEGHHPEFGAPATRNDVSRGVYGRITWGR